MLKMENKYIYQNMKLKIEKMEDKWEIHISFLIELS